MSKGRQERRDKRKREESETATSAEVNTDSPVILSFLNFRIEMDTHQDKHERLFKISRDITIISKRIIFNLHRTVGMNSLLELYLLRNEFLAL